GKKKKSVKGKERSDDRDLTSEEEKARRRAAKGKWVAVERDWWRGKEWEKRKAEERDLLDSETIADEHTGPGDSEERELHETMKASRDAHRRTNPWREQDSRAAQPDFLPPPDYEPGPSRLEETYTPTVEDLARAAVNRRRRRHQMKKKKERHQLHLTTETQTRSDLHAPTFGQEIRELEYRKVRAKHRRGEDSRLAEVGKEEWRAVKQRKGVHGIGLGEEERRRRSSSVTNYKEYASDRDWDPKMDAEPSRDQY
ncbi:hypothetical protein HK097_002992, partial [Rhizophlyctis rosea]